MFLNNFQVQSEVGMPIGNIEFPACFLLCSAWYWWSSFFCVVLGAGGLLSSA